MRVLVDTHAFIWELLDDPRSSSKARQILSFDTHELLFSLVSLWEIAIKVRIGKLSTIGSSVAYLRDERNAYGMELPSVSYEHLLALERLPLLHGDPFDRLLIAQASAESLPILTGDRSFQGYGVKLIWK